ncbi:TPM domain-containing protein [Leyella stercorea]|uniref:TPM domain-containing protein n=1 Tax=Leyella stercorea TaxID=363265 RepID=UPI0026DAAA70|nr:TPM domain-containing protein [Leyella stercorea]
MKRLIGLMLFLLVATLSFATGEEKQYTLQDVPNVRLSDARQYVSDPSHILSAPARDTINAVLARLEESTGIETAVVMLPSIGEEDIFNFGHELFRQWGIGKQKSNNGLLILFVADQRKVRFTVGYGLEGTMTDAMSKRIQMQRMVPRFKAGDWDGGMVDGVRAAAQVLDGSMQPEPTDDDEDMLVGIIALLIIIGIAIFVIFLVGEAQRCPKCHKKGVKRVAQQVLRLSNGRRVRRTTFLCPHCGHTFTRDENIDDSGNAAAFIAGAMLGGMGRRGGGFGGGISGGSFGGGSTGGGGSTSGW